MENKKNINLSDESTNSMKYGLPLEYKEHNEIENNQEALIIAFGVWLSGNYNTTNKEDEWFCSNDTPMGDKFTTTQLFELYKQQKQLSTNF